MRLVVIDDDALMLKNLGMVLTDLGFTVDLYNHPREGLDAIRDQGADIVITDIMMPEMDGFDVLREVHAIDSLCDVIFITGERQTELAIRALREGAADFFEKPFNLNALRAALERTTRYRMVTQQRLVLSAQVDELLTQLGSPSGPPPAMLGKSDAMQRVAEDIVTVAKTNATVLILGESGTGKELVARAIQRASALHERPMVTVNCASIPDDLFESEMFGHRKGAFTGAVESRTGYVAAADGGTLFLDEIGDMPTNSQPKILRLLEQKKYRAVGETEERTADVRLIAATNQGLQDMVEAKTFRSDLYYRLSVCTVTLPPLRERKEDVPVLALYFALQFSREMGKAIEGLDDDAIAALLQYNYPGNVRELRNIMESTVIHCRRSGALMRGDLPDWILPGSSPDSSDAAPVDTSAESSWPIDTVRFEDVERRLYEEALSRAESNVSAAARMLGLSRGKLRRRLAALGMDADD